MFLVLAHHAAEFSFEDEFELDELFHLTAAFAAGEKRTRAIRVQINLRIINLKTFFFSLYEWS